jgi:hypothetical protein
MRKKLFKLIIIFILFYNYFCFSINIPKKINNNSCLVIYAEKNFDFDIPIYQGIEFLIKGDKISKQFTIELKNYIDIERIGSGIYNNYYAMPRLVSGYNLSDYENLSIKNKCEIKIDPNSIVIFPYKIIYSYDVPENMKNYKPKNNAIDKTTIVKSVPTFLSIKMGNLTEDEINDIVDELIKNKNFKEYENIYLGNNKLKLKSSTSSNSR